MDLSCSESSEDFSPDSPTYSILRPQPIAPAPHFQLPNATEVQQELRRMLSNELNTVVPAGYLCRHPSFTSRHRELLISWISLAAFHLKFNFTTSSLAANLLDRYFCQHQVDVMEGAPPLAAVACLSIAAKMEEVSYPDNVEYLQVGTFWDRVYSASEIKRMELTVLTALEWRTLAVTPAALLDPLLSSLDVQPAGYDESAWLELRYSLREHCLLLLARALQVDSFLGYRPSSVAVAAIIEALAILQLQELAAAWEVLLLTAVAQEVHACQQHLAQLAGTAGMILPHVGKRCLKVVTNDSSNIKVYNEMAGLMSTPTSVLKDKHYAGAGCLHPGA